MFYEDQFLESLNERMQDFIAAMDMMWIATSDARGNCDVSFRAGFPGFVRVLDAGTLIWPEYRGNGVLASQGNISENPHVGLMFLDFFESTVGLHVNGAARLIENAALEQDPDVYRLVADDLAVGGGRHPERWIRVTVEEAYIHCAKHVPALARVEKTRRWGTDNMRAKGGDFFRAKAERDERTHRSS